MGKKPHNQSNLESEDSGINMLLEEDSRLRIPTLAQKKSLLSILDFPNIFTRSFDLVRLNVDSFDSVKSRKDFVLIEVKVTSKKLVEFPSGFFFGLTKNEETLLQGLEGTFLLCLVSIHPESRKSIYLDHYALTGLIKNKRIQYQINL
jgi:hypothetical protein